MKLYFFLMLIVMVMSGCGGSNKIVCTGALCGKTIETGRAAFVAAEKVSQVMNVPVSGKVTVIDFWDKHCPPCIEAMPHWNALYSRMNPEQAVFVGVSLDDKIDDARAAIREDSRLQVGFPMLHDGAALILSEIYEVGIERPVTLVVSAAGEIIYDSRGSDKNAVAEVEMLLSKLGVLR